MGRNRVSKDVNHVEQDSKTHEKVKKRASEVLAVAYILTHDHWDPLTYDEPNDVNFTKQEGWLLTSRKESFLGSCISIALWQIRGGIEHRAPYLGVRFVRTLFAIIDSAGTDM